MRYVLTGVETRNKGGELMLYAILQQIEKRDPNAEVYVSMSAVEQGLDYVHTRVNLKNKPYKKEVELANKLHIPGILYRLRIPTGHYFSDARPVKEVDYLIDGSGFWFTDQWNLEDAEVQMWDAMLRNYRKQGTRIVFLPQAFGPIELPNTKFVINSIGSNSDLIMAREKISYDYMVKAGVDKNKLRVYPDFTSLVEGHAPEKYSHLFGGVCVIPNMRMIDRGAITYEKYLDILKVIIQKAQSEGKLVYLLNHEGKQDENLALKCKRSLGDSIEVVTDLNGLEVKGLISTAYMVVTSRFHGLASALNSCVPSLATSWSHKYAELLKDYGQSDCVLNLNDVELIKSKIVEFLNSEKNNQIRQSIADNVPKIKAKTQDMWNEVWQNKKK